MKQLNIIRAKIEPDIYRLVESGVKQYEVRAGSFGHAEVVAYVASDDERFLGAYEIGNEVSFLDTGPSSREFVQPLSGVCMDDLDRLIPPGQNVVLHVAHIGCRVPLSSLIGAGITETGLETPICDDPSNLSDSDQNSQEGQVLCESGHVPPDCDGSRLRRAQFDAWRDGASAAMANRLTLTSSSLAWAADNNPYRA